MALELVWVKQRLDRYFHGASPSDYTEWFLANKVPPGGRQDWPAEDYPLGAYETIGCELPMAVYLDDVVVPVRLLDPDEQEANHQMVHQCLGAGEECPFCGREP